MKKIRRVKNPKKRKSQKRVKMHQMKTLRIKRIMTRTKDGGMTASMTLMEKMLDGMITGRKDLNKIETILRDLEMFRGVMMIEKGTGIMGVGIQIVVTVEIRIDVEMIEGSECRKK